MVVDNGAGDTNAAVGRISVSVSDGHASEFASSYPSAGSPTSPILSLNYDIDAQGFAAFNNTPLFRHAGRVHGNRHPRYPGRCLRRRRYGNVLSGAGSFSSSGVPPIFYLRVGLQRFSGDFRVHTYFLAIRVNPTAGVGEAHAATCTVQTVQTVPDGGTTATLLGSVLVALGLLRRRLGNG